MGEKSRATPKPGMSTRMVRHTADRGPAFSSRLATVQATVQLPARLNAKLEQRAAVLCNGGYTVAASGIAHGRLRSAEHQMWATLLGFVKSSSLRTSSPRP